jgi:hypothetical protein
MRGAAKPTVESLCLRLALALGACASCSDAPAPPAQSTTDAPASDTSSATGTSTTTQGEAPDHAPPTPTLVSPADGANEIEIEGQELCWNLVEDPQGDPVRYRVFLDDYELTEGRLDAPGHEGPCIGPLNFAYEQSYAWQVQAFHPAFPDSASERSATWAFTTASDGLTHTVFEDPFDDDLGWEIDGDAGSGAWIRSNPVPTTDLGEAAQPDNCAGGQSCYFTGQNPDGVVDDADVAGGSTILTSPAFDLSGSATATVALSRFFYKSAVEETGTSLRIELLSPDPEAPGQDRAFVLEQIDIGGALASANTWTPVEFSACGLPMLAGSRLRISATDLGDGILEAAIDSVLVTGHVNDDLCNGGIGSLCDPQDEGSCARGLWCCPKGDVDTGAFRCDAPTAGLDFDNPTSDPGAPGNGPLGCNAPDLVVTDYLYEDGEQVDVIDACEDSIDVSPNSCELFEGCVDGPGLRRVLRFSTITPNIGSRDLTMGVPSNHPDLFQFSACHAHYHFNGYAGYQLLDGDDIVAVGHKQAFCLLDWESWAWPGDDNTYTCGNQGIGRGWYDEYGPYLPCQWIDITDVAPGSYTLRIEVNLPQPETSVRTLVERDYTNNVLETPVVIDGVDDPNCG